MLYEAQQRILDRAGEQALFAMDVGTGKTLTGIYHYLKWRRHPFTPLIVFTPKAKVIEGGWDREIARVEELENVTIPYDIRTIDSITKLSYKEVVYSAFICDEVHAYKAQSSRGLAFVELMKASNQSVALLSATPASKGWGDCMNYFAAFGFDEVLERGKRNNKLKYIPKYAEYAIEKVHLKGGKSRSYEIVREYKNTDQLEKMFQTFTYKLSAEEIDTLPERTFETIHFKKTPLYNAMTRERVRVVDGVPEPLDTPSKLCHALRRESNTKAKLDYLEVILEGTTDNVVVFYVYTEHLDELKKLTDKLGKQTFVISGDTKEIPDNDITDSVVLVQYQAGGSGIELAMCHISVMFSPTYSWQDDIQALGRTYGGYRQKARTHVYRFVCEGIEQEIMGVLEENKDFSEQLFFKRNQGV